MLVVPGTPTGTPAVTTTRLPCSTSPAFWAASTANSTSSSVLEAMGIRMGVTPQLRAIWRCTCSSSRQAITCVPGRKRLTSRAVVPRWLTVMIASASTSAAVVQAAWAVAAAMDRWRLGAAFFIRLA